MVPVLLAHTLNTYHGEQITPESLIKLAPQLDTYSEQAVQAWLYDNKHIIAALTNMPIHGELEQRTPRRDHIIALLEKAGIKNMSNHNYVFTIQGDDEKKYVIKIAGPANRRENYNALLKKPYGTSTSLKEYQELEKNNKAKYYQALSRAAHSLRFKEWVENHPKTKAKTPNAYVVHIPGQSKEVIDGNYLVVEDYIENMGTPDKHPKTFLDAARDVAEASAYACLWNIASRQFLITEEDEVFAIDLEQPNNSNPEDFFHNNKEKCIGNTHVGLDELSTMCKELAAKLTSKEEVNEQ